MEDEQSLDETETADWVNDAQSSVFRSMSKWLRKSEEDLIYSRQTFTYQSTWDLSNICVNILAKLQ